MSTSLSASVVKPIIQKSCGFFFIFSGIDLLFTKGILAVLSPLLARYIEVGVLGIHKNSKFAEFLQLNLIDEGDNYRVRGDNALKYIKFPLYNQSKEDILTPIKTKPTGLDSDPLGPATPDIAIVKVFDSAWLHKPANISLTVSKLTAPWDFKVLSSTFKKFLFASLE